MAKAGFGMPKGVKGTIPTIECPKCKDKMILVKKMKSTYRDSNGNKILVPGGMWWSCKNEKCNHLEKKR